MIIKILGWTLVIIGLILLAFIIPWILILYLIIGGAALLGVD